MQNLILNQFQNLNEKDKSNLLFKIYEANFANTSILFYALLLIHIPIILIDYQKYKAGLWILNSGYEYVFRMHIGLYIFLILFLLLFQFLKRLSPKSNLIIFFSYTVSLFLQIWCAIFSAIDQRLFGDTSIYLIALFGLPILLKFKAAPEFIKFLFVHLIFVYSVPIFQSVPERTEGVWINSTVAAVLAFLASRINFSFKVRELASHSIILKQKDQLSAEKEKVEEATESKNEFIANMSHEIQSQMNGVVGILQLLDSTKLNEEQKEYVSIIDSSVKNLLTIISDILDFTRMEAGKTELANKPFELPSLINEILSISSSVASLNNNIVKSSIAPDVPKYIYGDRILLSQILLNLLGNAVKFTKSGRIDIIVSVQQRKDLKVFLKFEVKDTGVGIPESRLDTIFEMYTKGEISSSRIYKGTGLGLAISKRLVEMMNGKIGLESVEGKGSNFHFTIQTESYDHLTDKTVAVTDTKPQYTKVNSLSRAIQLKILLVDDNEINIKLGKKVFEKLGYDVKTAYDGQEAVDICLANQFDIVFMDLRMPVLNGFEATELINKTKKDITDKPLIIALTANANNTDREKCLKLGMVDFITKPLDVSRIKDYIIRVIDKYDLTH